MEFLLSQWVKIDKEGLVAEVNDRLSYPEWYLLKKNQQLQNTSNFSFKNFHVNPTTEVLGHNLPQLTTLTATDPDPPLRIQDGVIPWVPGFGGHRGDRPGAVPREEQRTRERLQDESRGPGHPGRRLDRARASSTVSRCFRCCVSHLCKFY